MRLDPDRVPASAVPLIPMAARWGIGDDFDRERAVHDAASEDIATLAAVLDGVGDEFWDWLGGPESYEQTPSEEYIAFSNLTMAVDTARLLVKRGADGDPG